MVKEIPSGSFDEQSLIDLTKEEAQEQLIKNCIGNHRIVGNDTVITADYQPLRLNVFIGQNNKVIDVFFG